MYIKLQILMGLITLMASVVEKHNFLTDSSARKHKVHHIVETQSITITMLYHFTCGIGLQLKLQLAQFQQDNSSRKKTPSASNKFGYQSERIIACLESNQPFFPHQELSSLLKSHINISFCFFSSCCSFSFHTNMVHFLQWMFGMLQFLSL